MTNKIKSILDFCETNNIEIVSYGLAPNPFGFCFEIGERPDEEIEDARCDADTLKSMLDALTSSEEQQLRRLIFG